MTINLSDAASNTMLDALARLMDGGKILLISETDRVLASLPLSDPAATFAADGVLEFRTIAEAIASAAGRASSASIVAAEGGEIFSCDVGDENSDATLKLATTEINRNNRVQIASFKLVMP